MRLLLDTHAALWFWWDDARLSTVAKDAIRDPANQKLVSWASPWEVAIKVSLHKLDIGGPFAGFFSTQMLRTYFEWLAPSDDHFAALAALPFHHKDPFDRLLIAQAMCENVPLVSGDVQFDAYGVQRLW